MTPGPLSEIPTYGCSICLSVIVFCVQPSTYTLPGQARPYLAGIGLLSTEPIAGVPTRSVLASDRMQVQGLPR